MKYLLCVFTLLSLTAAHAFTLSPHLDKDNFVHIAAPYTLGTHKGIAADIRGQIEIDPVKKSIVSATVSVPLSSIDMGKAEMTCHLKESLGLSYSGTNFPKEHVCDSKHTLPLEGKNAIAFADISFRLKSMLPVSAQDKGAWKASEVVGEWTLHGVTKELKSVMWVLEENGTYKVKGEQVFSLKDFGVIVKPFFVIKVKDQVRAAFEFSVR